MCIRFQQPAPMNPGVLGNVGWREEESLNNVTPSAAVPVPVATPAAPGLDSSKKYITKAMLAKHTEEESVWFAYKGSVYDGTPFLEDHPGGADSIIMAGGEDATEDFDAVHSDAAKKQLEKYYLAELAPENIEIPVSLLYLAPGEKPPRGRKSISQEQRDEAKEDPAAPFLDAKKQKKVFLKEKIQISHDVFLFRFALDHDKQLLGLPTGKHMLVRKKVTKAGGEEEIVMRAYTPTTANETRGHFDLVVKIYRANTHPKFPDGGKFSQVSTLPPLPTVSFTLCVLYCSARYYSCLWAAVSSSHCYHHVGE